MQEFYLFLMTFVLVFLIYELFVVRKEKKGKSKKKPIEVRFLEARYHLDLKKTNYKQLLNIISLVSAFDIALIVTIIMFAKSFILELLLGATLIFPIILVSYHFVGAFYQKKGMKKDV